MKTKDFLVSKETFRLIHDPKLDILVTTPQPEVSKLGKYYDSDQYISHNDTTKGLLAKVYAVVKKYALIRKLSLVNSLQKKKGSLLDIGAGTGDFLNAASKNNWQTIGVELNPKAKKLAQEKGLLIHESLAAVKNQKFDVITLWHVLEHLPDLNETINTIEGLLTSNGVLVIAVPNFKSYDAKHYKNFWAAYDVPRHLWHFSRNSMKQLFSKNIKLKRIKPMVFDSFYVSLLSQKYKTGNPFSIKAILIGLRSNISAWRTKEYSSLIYCYKNRNKQY